MPSNPRKIFLAEPNRDEDNELEGNKSFVDFLKVIEGFVQINRLLMAVPNFIAFTLCSITPNHNQQTKEYITNESTFIQIFYGISQNC